MLGCRLIACSQGSSNHQAAKVAKIHLSNAIIRTTTQKSEMDSHEMTIVAVRLLHHQAKRGHDDQFSYDDI